MYRLAIMSEGFDVLLFLSFFLSPPTFVSTRDGNTVSFVEILWDFCELYTRCVVFVVLLYWFLLGFQLRNIYLQSTVFYFINEKPEIDLIKSE